MSGSLARPHRAAAALSLGASALALAVSVWLARVKFGVDYWCEASGCDASGTCDEALASPWSQFLGIPWPLWASGLAAANVWLALPFARGRPSSSAAAGLLVLGLVAALTAVVLASHAFMHFQHLCRFCVALYVACALWLASAALIARRLRPLDLRDALPGAALTLAVTAALTLGYRLVAQRASCAVPGQDLPPGGLVVSSAEARFVSLVFLDPTCEACAREFGRLRAMHRDLQRRDLTLHIYMFPRLACDETRLPAHEFVDGRGNEITHSDARTQHACFAARVTLCAERLAPGRGLDVLASLFLLKHDKSAPTFSRARVTGALGKVGGGVVPDAVLACVDSGEADELLTAHQRYFLAWLHEQGTGAGVPRMFVAPVVRGRVELSRARYARDVDKVVEIVSR